MNATTVEKQMQQQKQQMQQQYIQWQQKQHLTRNGNISSHIVYPLANPEVTIKANVLYHDGDLRSHFELPNFLMTFLVIRQFLAIPQTFSGLPIIIIK